MRKLPGGFQSGAYLVRDGAGDAVLKWTTQKWWAARVLGAAPLVAAVRESGWPTPAWRLAGTTPAGFPYVVQDFAAGAEAGLVSEALVVALLPIIDLQAGLAPATDVDWSAYARNLIFGESKEEPARISAFSASGKAFLEVVAEWTSPYRDIVLRNDDLVHGDMNPENVLLVDGQVTAILDVEAIGRGSRFMDVASLLMHCYFWEGEPGAVRLLVDYAKTAEPGEFEISLAMCMIGNLDFQVRNDPGAVEDLLKIAMSVPDRL